MGTTLEVLTTTRNRREHRQWPDDIRARIVSESLRPGGTVNEVADRYRLKANHLLYWRTLARQGELVLPEPEDAVEFAAMVVDMPAPELPAAKTVSRAKIVVDLALKLPPNNGVSVSRLQVELTVVVDGSRTNR